MKKSKRKLLKILSIFRAIGEYITSMKQKQDSIKENKRIRKSSENKKEFLEIVYCIIYIDIQRQIDRYNFKSQKSFKNYVKEISQELE